MLVDDPLWYKDAVIYHMHVKGFSDSDGDGFGDFKGLTGKLDYIQTLGATAVWLLPFYPSPLRDDGYDIADYFDVHPRYGTLRDFKAFVRAAHRRGLRVITELVINHTSEQHPWFQEARRAPPGSPKREFYVWSDTDQKFSDTRIIFKDTESSNWAWDPVARAFYWHRFFSHQPDLNHNNPRVVKAVLKVLRFWLDAGVDGLRLDAIPYLCVREGTSNENLPETHEVIRQVRAEVDAHYTNRMLLAEANQWPEDVIHYFGQGDECHLAFHFPVMPRIYLAVAQGDRDPITDILRQTPAIPDTCQWAMFLRNHDELTLEMVTERERAAMLAHYAKDPRMVLNLGIRRRLAPLMDNDRRRIELLNALLLSMPGTPIIYYGDELGMGDNVYIGDRDGVRTPMQWSSDRNAGFSRADPQQLYLPVITDPIYGYEAVNVEAMQRSPASLLNWMRALIDVRKRHRAFGRGDLNLLYPANHHILAYLRQDGDELLLCVFNLAPSSQPVELDLRALAGRRPIELLGDTVFPRIGELPYLLTLPAHGFYWFRLVWADQLPAETERRPELPYVVVRREEAVVDELRRGLNVMLPDFVRRQRWFQAKGGHIVGIEHTVDRVWEKAEGEWLWSLVTVHLDGQEPQSYSLPLAVLWDEPAERVMHDAVHRVLAKIRRGTRVGVVCDAYLDPQFCLQVASAFDRTETLAVAGGELCFHATRAYLSPGTLGVEQVRPLDVEQSHTSVLIGSHQIYKSFRRLQHHVSSEVEIGRYLTDDSPFTHSPPVHGHLELRDAQGQARTLGVLIGFVQNQGDAWTYTSRYLEQHVESRLAAEDRGEKPSTSAHATYRAFAQVLGRRTGELHRALARPSSEPAFAPQPIASEDLGRWNGIVLADAQRTLQVLEERLPHLEDSAQHFARELMERREELLATVAAQRPTRATGLRCRFHGDFHLGQVLVQDGDVQIIDFEGEMARPEASLDDKHSPLRDVAGMLRSFNYAAFVSLAEISAGLGHAAELEDLLRDWEHVAATSFVEGYREAIAGQGIVPDDEADFESLLRLFLLEKALYEINYELHSRPRWVLFPLRGVLGLLDATLAAAPRPGPSR
ncbi:MAG: maltose alpha-D-glucosyltransferase [Pseudomonadota bacterium]